MKMPCYVIPELPEGKEHHVYLSHSNNPGEVQWVENTLLKQLESRGFKCVFKDRDFKYGGTEVKNINEFFCKSWKFVLVVSPDYIELAEEIGPVALESSIIMETFSKDKSKVACLVLKACDFPPTLTIYKQIQVKYNPNWFKILLEALGAKDPSKENKKESSFRHCSMCNSDFPEDFRQFQCFVCRKIGCLGCCNYMAPISANFIRMERVCHACFEQEARHRHIDNIRPAEAELTVTSDPDAYKFGFIILIHYGFGGVYNKMNSTRSTPQYCDLCKTTSSEGMSLAQCKICHEIGCRACINYRASLTTLKIAMVTACFTCSQVTQKRPQLRQ